MKRSQFSSSPLYARVTCFGFLLLSIVVPHAAWAGSTLLGVNFGNQLIRIDQSTGVSTLIGPLDSPMSPFGIANRNGQLYVYDQIADKIRQIDPATGHTLQTIDIGTGHLVGEGDISFDAAGTGYLSVASGSFYRFDVTTATSTLISSSLPFNIDGMTFVNGTLYAFTDFTSNNWLTINPLTGAASVLAPFAPTGFLGGLAVDSSSGILYAALYDSTLGDRLYTVDPTTGATALVGPISGVAGVGVSGLAFVVPEPRTLVLFVLGMAAIGRRMRCKRNTAY